MKTRVLLVVLPLLAVSCRDNGASVTIQEICFPTNDCTFSNSCDKVLLGNPVIDVGSGDSSVGLFLQVANQLDDNSDEATHRTNTNDAHIDEIVVEYKGVAIPEQIRLTNQRIPTNATQLVSVMAIPAGFDAVLVASQALALVRMRGYFDNGDRFETAEFPIAVEVCDGCVAPCPTGMVACAPGFNDGQEPKTCFDPSGAGST